MNFVKRHQKPKKDKWGEPSSTSAGAFRCHDPSKICEQVQKEMDEERRRHKKVMKETRDDYEEEKKKLEQKASRYGVNLESNCTVLRREDNIFAKKNEMSCSDRQEEFYRMGEITPGYCIVISNAADSSVTSCGESLAQSFLRLKFNVRLGLNLNEQEMLHLLQDAARRGHDYSCFLFIIIGKGSSEYIKSADGKKIKFKNIVKLFSPYNGIGLDSKPRAIIFQSSGDERTKSSGDDESRFALDFDDAFVLCSTHRKFLSTLEKKLGKNPSKSFQAIVEEATDVIMATASERESLQMVSTLRKALYLRYKRNDDKSWFK